MAASGGGGKSAVDETTDCLTLHEMFKIISSKLSCTELEVLKKIYYEPFLLKSTDSRNIQPKSLKTGYDFFLAMEQDGKVDKHDFKNILHLLSKLTRHELMHYVTLRRRPTVISDPVEDYLEETMQPRAKKSRLPCSTDLASKKSLSCDIKLRVRAEYCQHDEALQGVASSKPEQIERQFERFQQASSILRTRDLGSIICDIKFSELTYLDAFWRDYLNGSLLEALKGVFITESLKQAVGHEAIKLLVNVDEDDYESGRKILIQTLDR